MTLSPVALEAAAAPSARAVARSADGDHDERGSAAALADSAKADTEQKSAVRAAAAGVGAAVNVTA